MPKTRCKEVYQFDELSDTAKEKAREWYRNGAFDYDWWESVYEDFQTVAATLGFTISERRQGYCISGKPETKYRTEPNIFFSGFSSQGDGACFEGSFAAKDADPKAFKAHVGKSDTKTWDIGRQLLAFAKDHPNFYAGLKHSGRYSHEHSVSVDCEELDQDNEDILTRDTEDAFTDLARDFMRYLYQRLEQEFDYLNADEQVDDNIRCNEYEFTEDGNRYLPAPWGISSDSRTFGGGSILYAGGIATAAVPCTIPKNGVFPKRHAAELEKMKRQTKDTRNQRARDRYKETFWIRKAREGGKLRKPLELAAIQAETNGAVKAAMIKIFGFERFFTQIQAETLDTLGEYRLLQYPLNSWQTVKALKMVCPSTQLVHVHAVPPNVNTISEALDWMFQTDNYLEKLQAEA